jgi:hypothetical protein
MHMPMTRSLLRAATVVLIWCSPSWAQTPCGVTDPVGDFLGQAVGTLRPNPCEGPGCEPWHDIVQASVLRDGGLLRLAMTVAEPVPAAPPQRAGGKKDVWAWNLDTDPATAPQGFPFDPATVAASEFVVRVIWDGTSFSGIVIDRRPLLTGGQASITPVGFEVNGSSLTAIVDLPLLGNPSSLKFRAATQDYVAFDGTGGFFAEDRTDLVSCSW